MPAVEQDSVREKQHQMLRSQLQDYLSLNKLHYCIYYPGVHRLRGGKKHFADLMFTQHLSAPHWFPQLQSNDKVKTRGLGGVFLSENML